ncbi:MAG: DegV family protein [Lachnospiraceae bacterium]|nr:DegV family protein [Lachnospiraceae bacterium]
MVQIITDSSTLYKIDEAQSKGFEAVPLCVSIGDWDGRDLHMDYDRFYDTIKSGQHPKSSQPPIGDVVDAFEKYPNDEIINISMADGLSGTYQSACSAREMVEHKDNITVINSRTLCGPHRYMVTMAQKMKEEGKTAKEIIDWVVQKSHETHSWLIPQDFGFLRRGGRMTPTAAAIGSVLKLKPVLTLTEDCKKLDKFAIKRTFSSAVKAVLDSLDAKKFNKDYIFYVVHARAHKDCQMAVDMIKKAFPEVEVQTYELSHAFITQGGPQCVAIQYIKR